MKSADRMFRVLVLGGIALTACGGTTVTSSADSGTPADGFPQEGPQQVDAFPTETAQQVDAFPAETAQQVDAFPMEGPAFIDAGQDAPCFPQETALPSDASCGGSQGNG
jgi:hypothetical protein